MIEVIVCLLPDVINSAGLALDIGGVILLFCYGLPEEVSKSGGITIEWGNPGSEQGQRKWKRYKRRSTWGLFLLVLGFFLQLVSNWL